MSNNSEMQQNLYKILRMNIILAKSSGEVVSEETLQSFDEAAKKIDEIDNIKYDNDTKNLYYSTTTLEEEARRLEKLIKIIDKRLEDRRDLVIDYRETTNRPLEGLGYIKDENKTNEYKDRLININSYLYNKDSIINIEEEIKELHANLDECYNNKKVDEANNAELEDDLLLTFKNLVSSSDYSDILAAVDIDFEMEKIRPNVEEAKKTLNTFETAFNNLKKAGISKDSEAEYSSYVEESKKSYYFIKEKEYLFKIYKIIIDSKSIYSELYIKRESLDIILEERLDLRTEIGILEDDLLSHLYQFLDKQNKTIKKQKDNIDKIAEIEEKIKFKEIKLAELKENNQKVEILYLLQEFGIIDTYKGEIPQVQPKEEIKEEEKKEEVKVENQDELLPNMVVQIKDAYETLDLSFVKNKADTVMRRVARSLGYAPEVKKESIVTFDFDKPKEEIKEEQSEENKSNITFPNVEASSKDNDFWAVENNVFFPNESYKIDQEQPGIKLDFPLDFGGNDENRD